LEPLIYKLISNFLMSSTSTKTSSSVETA